MIQNREFEIRKESPSTLKIINNDISSEMGPDVAQSMGLEYPCINSDQSDDGIVEEKPVIPEVTYDGDKERDQPFFVFDFNLRQDHTISFILGSRYFILVFVWKELSIVGSENQTNLKITQGSTL